MRVLWGGCTQKEHPSILKVPSILSLECFAPSLTPPCNLEQDTQTRKQMLSFISVNFATGQNKQTKSLIWFSVRSLPWLSYLVRNHKDSLEINLSLDQLSIVADHPAREQGEEAVVWKVFTYRPRWQRAWSGYQVHLESSSSSSLPSSLSLISLATSVERYIWNHRHYCRRHFFWSNLIIIWKSSSSGNRQATAEAPLWTSWSPSRSSSTFSAIYHQYSPLFIIIIMFDPRSSANRQTRMEGAEINKSLLALKECIRWWYCKAWWLLCR